VGSGNLFIPPPARLKTGPDPAGSDAQDLEIPSFSEYTKLTGLKAEPQMPEELEQRSETCLATAKPELFKKLTGPDPLPQR
jgi:hypothetical protein